MSRNQQAGIAFSIRPIQTETNLDLDLHDKRFDQILCTNLIKFYKNQTYAF